MKRLLIIPALMVASCGGNTVTVSESPRVSYQDIQPAAGMTYQEFRRHPMGQGDMLAAQKRFLLLDRNHDGKLSPHELGGDN